MARPAASERRDQLVEPRAEARHLRPSKFDEHVNFGDAAQRACESLMRQPWLTGFAGRGRVLPVALSLWPDGQQLVPRRGHDGGHSSDHQLLPLSSHEAAGGRHDDTRRCDDQRIDGPSYS